MTGCFLAVKPGTPSLLIPVNLAWRFHAERYQILDPPENSPVITEPIRLDDLMASKGEGPGEELPPVLLGDTLAGSSPLRSTPRVKKGRGTGKKKRTRKKG